MTLAQQFAARLRQERRRKAFEEEADVSWEDVAQAVELSGAAISRYVKGRVIPDDAILGRLAAYFGVRVSWLRYGEGERAAPQDREPRPRPASTAPAKAAGGGGRKPRR